MAQRFYDIDLQETNFPMLHEQQGRTIIGSTAGESPSKENRPHIAYCHNVMPSKHGMDSVGFLTVVPAFSGIPAGLEMSDERIIYGDAATRMSLAWDGEGNVYALKKGATAWIALPATVPATGGVGFDVDSVTVARVDGISYIFYSGIGAFNYNEITDSLDAVTLAGLDISTVLGLVASSGYLIAYTIQAIAWSSTILATDFVPSQVTGAGGGNIAGLAGNVLFITSNTLGIIAYTEANAVTGTYTGNARFPFKFRELPNSKGGITLDRVAYEANSSLQYVYSKAGLQAITSQSAKNIIPEVTDFLAGKRFETYNETTKLYEITDLSAGETMLKKIKYIASRYLIVSYGLPNIGFSHALIFDTSLNKLGKIKLDHTDVFEYIGAQDEISKESIAFLRKDGEVKVLDFSTVGASSGVLILGKLQFTRNRFITLQGVDIENVESASTLEVLTQVSLDGKNFTTVAGFLSSSANNLRIYDFRSSGKNHSIVLIGKFNSVTAQVIYTVDGRR